MTIQSPSAKNGFQLKGLIINSIKLKHKLLTTDGYAKLLWQGHMSFSLARFLLKKDFTRKTLHVPQY